MSLPAPLPAEAASPRRAVVTGIGRSVAEALADGGLLLMGAQHETPYRDWRSP
ncbi:hypothetical protein [Amycolatopsis balhimycina]|uniref:hypothetical protein n=1 Tax=Amycolatopsis balhimycina TaxID=208443 RepID=UPI00039BBE44|nr:hypothetical protein [Amycolatopsis balhimycina]